MSGCPAFDLKIKSFVIGEPRERKAVFCLTKSGTLHVRRTRW